MFIRKTRKVDRSTNREYHLFQLVESYRTEKGPRQRILLNLGSDLNLPDEERKLLANRIEELLNGYSQSLTPYAAHIEQLAEKYTERLVRRAELSIQEEHTPVKEDFHSVDLASLQHERCRSVGMEHISIETIKQLGIDQKLEELGLTKRQIQVALGVIVARLVQPSSELGTYQWLQTQSGIDELLNADFTKLGLRSVYQAGDNLLKHKDALEVSLREKEKELFGLDDVILLYDLTNTFFEGTAKCVKKAARGHSKEKRKDCPLVTLGLILDTQGFPCGSEVLPGNISESKTLKNALSRLMEGRVNNPIVIMDAGIATEENLLYLRENGYRYIVASKRRCVDIPSDLQLELIKEDRDNCVHAAQVKDDNTGEITLYCHSYLRQKKEENMRHILQERFEKDMQQAALALQKKGGTKAYSKVLERIGRLKEKHKRISSYYEVEVVPDGSGLQAGSISWEVKKSKLDPRFHGGYSLRVFGLDWNSEALWNTYVMLTKVEEAFRCLKSDLGLRPIYHQQGKRVDAHLFITVLSYHIMQAILHKLKTRDISIRWGSLCNLMSSQVRVTSKIKLESGDHVRIRTTTTPEYDQRQIYEALKISKQPGKQIRIQS